MQRSGKRGDLDPDPGCQQVTHTTVAGDLYQIQGVAGGVTAYATSLVRSAYLEQVRRIAPPQLQERDQELTELVAFCSSEGQAPYVWWQGEAWAGKSALMSWFVLHPPPGVQLVSFFITARFAGQNDRAAFVDIVLEQLAELLGESMPAYLTEATREPHLLRMLAQTAAAYEQQGRRLVLVVDGMDEDRGVTTEPDAYSIAALLPVRPPAGMRIIVAGRPHPPIPGDVPSNHPLRDRGIVRSLDRSMHAEVIRTDAQRELKRLLRGTPTEQDLLGLVTAAGGGLSSRDLAELTGLSEYEVKDLLSAVAGRTFRTRVTSINIHSDATQVVYVLAHEELQQTASYVLSEQRLLGYRQRLHDWASRYRETGWPERTPEYLLRGYYRMLHATADIPRMVALATDRIRHDRMLDITGGDTAAVTEIMETQDHILGLDCPDLLAMARLSARRNSLAERNANTPVGLPAVWAALGHPSRAEALAYAITDPVRRARALAAVAHTSALAGDRNRAAALVERAESLADAITDKYRQADVLALIAEASAANGDHDRATAPQRNRRESFTGLEHAVPALAEAAVAVGDLDWAEALASAISMGPITQRRSFVMELARVAKAAATTGNHDPAKAWARQAEALASTISVRPETRALWLPVMELADLAEAAAMTGNHDRAGAWARQAEALASTVTDYHEKTLAVAWQAVAAAAAGDIGPVIVLAEQIRHKDVVYYEFLSAGKATRSFFVDDRPLNVTKVLARLAEVVAAAGDLVRAETFTSIIPDPSIRALTLAKLAVIAVGDLPRVETLVTQAEPIARGIIDPGKQAKALAAIARALAAVDEKHAASSLIDQAEEAAHAIALPCGRVWALAAIAEAAITNGDDERATALARQSENLALAITNPVDQAKALASLATVVAATGDLGRAEALIYQATIVVCRQGTRYRRWESEVANAITANGDFDRAESRARSITDLGTRVEALTWLAEASTAAGDLDRATALAHQAEHLARTITHHGDQARAFASLATALAAAGDLDRAAVLIGRADTLTRAITDPNDQARTLATVAKAAIAIGDLDRAIARAKAAAVQARITNDLGLEATMIAVMVEATVATGDLDRAEAISDTITDPRQKAETMAAVAEAIANSGDHNRANVITDQAEALAGAISDPSDQARAWAAVAKAAAAAGDFNRAEALADASVSSLALDIVGHSVPRAVEIGALVAIASVAAAIGDLDRAEKLAATITRLRKA
jgi:tetratricopeptide (TPR) repeat protein